MPFLVRLFIRTSIIHFVFALILGVLTTSMTLFAALRPVYFHVLMVGWVTQLIIGVAYWMFPRYSKEKPRGEEWFGWVIYLTLNAGLLLRIVGEPLQIGWVLVASAAFQLIAGWMFVIAIWPRVRGR